MSRIYSNRVAETVAGIRMPSWRRCELGATAARSTWNRWFASIRRPTLTAALVAAMVCNSPTGAQEAEFQGLGQPPGLTSGSYAYAVSGDGSVVVGGALSIDNPGPFRWTADTGMVVIGSFPPCENLNNGSALDASSDGSVVVGAACLNSGPNCCPGCICVQAFRWDNGNIEEILGPNNDCQITQAWGVSDDGDVFVGVLRNGDCAQQAYVWNGSMMPLSGGPQSFAWDVSGDGSVVVGRMQTPPIGSVPARWVDGGTGEMLHPSIGEATNASFSGTVIVGSAKDSDNVNAPSHAFRWTESSGVEFLPTLPDSEGSIARGVSDDGQVIVGKSQISGQGDVAFIWDSQSGKRRLRTVLEADFGLDMTGWTLREARDVSADGTVVVGVGTNPGGNTEAFRAVVPRAACPAVEITGNGATLNFVPNITFTGISTDGDTAVGTFIDPDDPEGIPLGITWTAADGMVTINPLPGDTASALIGASCQAETIAGTSSDDDTTRGFVDAGGAPFIIEPLGSCVGAQVALHALSNDGFAVVGSSTVSSGGCVTPIYWQGNLVELPLLPGGTDGEALGMAGDGNAIVGYVNIGGGPRITLWPDLASPPEDLGADQATDASYDGAVVVGTTANGQAFRWTEDDGVVTIGAGAAATISDDGSTIGGISDTGAFIWRESTGMVDLPAHLAGLDIDASAFNFIEVTNVSTDGRVIVGRAMCDSGDEGGFVLTVDGPADTDGDGLLDTWEHQCGGIDGDGNGTDDFSLFERGARPWRKDIFVELDTMEGLQFSQEAIEMVVDVFAVAPVQNPGSVPFGIVLHVEIDETDLPFAEEWAGTGFPELDVLKAEHFGAPGDGPAVKLARAKAYRYCILANHTDPSAAGRGEVGGNDFLVFAASISTSKNYASALMHELGHNLNLRHGGDDPINGKPNYPSVMNYALSHEFDWSRTFWRLDYAGSDLEPEVSCGEGFNVLDEFDLDETVGIGSPAGRHRDYRMPFGVTVDGHREIRYARLNGSRNDFGDSDGSMKQDGFFEAGDVIQDLNYLGPDSLIGGTEIPTPDQSLFCRNDWATLQYAIDPEEDSRGERIIPEEPTDEAIAWIEENFPIPPCLADFDGDGSVAVLDLLALLDVWGTSSQAHDLDDSGAVDVYDLLDLLAHWGECDD
jgi:uncharacterized membrane protein